MQETNKEQVLSVVIVLLVCVIGFLVLRTTEAPAPAVAPATPALDTGEEHIYGDPNAEIVVIEYSDTECPFCKRFHQTMHDIVDRNGNVAWIYRHYPIAGLHQKAFHEAVATECAWEQGGNTTFWKYTDELYLRTNSNDSLDPAELSNIAEYLSLDMEAFNLCLSTEKYAAKVKSDILAGEQAGVEGTPMSLIMYQGKVVDTIKGAQPFSVVQSQIDGISR